MLPKRTKITETMKIMKNSRSSSESATQPSRRQLRSQRSQGRPARAMRPRPSAALSTNLSPNPWRIRLNIMSLLLSLKKLLISHLKKLMMTSQLYLSFEESKKLKD